MVAALLLKMNETRKDEERTDEIQLQQFDLMTMFASITSTQLKRFQAAVCFEQNHMQIIADDALQNIRCIQMYLCKAASHVTQILVAVLHSGCQ